MPVTRTIRRLRIAATVFLVMLASAGTPLEFPSVIAAFASVLPLARELFALHDALEVRA